MYKRYTFEEVIEHNNPNGFYDLGITWYLEPAHEGGGYPRNLIFDPSDVVVAYVECSEKSIYNDEFSSVLFELTAWVTLRDNRNEVIYGEYGRVDEDHDASSEEDENDFEDIEAKSEKDEVNVEGNEENEDNFEDIEVNSENNEVNIEEDDEGFSYSISQNDDYSFDPMISICETISEPVDPEDNDIIVATEEENFNYFLIAFPDLEMNLEEKESEVVDKTTNTEDT